VRYVESSLERFRREETYRIYVTDSLQLAPQSKVISERYYDKIYPKEEKSGDEILAEVMAGAGLRFEK